MSPFSNAILNLKSRQIPRRRFNFPAPVAGRAVGFPAAVAVCAGQPTGTVVVAAVTAINFASPIAFWTVLRCHKILSSFRDYALAVATRALAFPIAKLARGVIEKTCLAAPAALGAASFSFAARTFFYVSHSVSFRWLNVDPFGVVFARVVLYIIHDCHHREKQTRADDDRQTNRAANIFSCANDVRKLSGSLYGFLTT